jgi:tRNA wybutosine-synthesizing protein 2
MSFKQKLAKATGIKVAVLPSSYQIIGHVLLLKLPKIKSLNQKRKIASAILVLLPYVKTVCEIKEIRGEFREPSVTILAGNGTITTHKENGILYKLDAAKIMFSKGNLNERKRVINQVKDGELIIDMFAGIGYFSLGLAKFSKVREIIAIEKNSAAYNYFVENIELNKLTNISAMQGDCTIAAPSLKGMADRIIMGYLPGTENFLPYAMLMAKPGCVIHFHNTYKTKELWKKPLDDIGFVSRKFGFRSAILAKKKVKSYAPNVWHVVIDFQISRDKNE